MWSLPVQSLSLKLVLTETWEGKQELKRNEAIVASAFVRTYAGKSYWRGRLTTVDLLVLTTLDQLIFILKILFMFLQNKLP